MEHLKLLAERFAELSIDKRFPIIHWLTGYGVRVDIHEDYETFTVDFGDAALMYINRAWRFNVSEAFIFNPEAIRKTENHFQNMLDQFAERLPELKARHIINTQMKLMELQEELNQVAA
jgi:hypothetical protein